MNGLNEKAVYCRKHNVLLKNLLSNPELQGTFVKIAMMSVIKSLPPFRRLIDERDALIRERNELVRSHGIAPPGHFYSPIVSLDEVSKDQDRIFGPLPREITGIELNEIRQLELLSEFERIYPTIPFTATRKDGFRYFYENPAYSYSDTIFFHCMMRHLNPRRVIEVGSGYSSCVAMDTSDIFLEGRTSFTFIEPYPELLLSLISQSDKSRISLLSHRLQDVPHSSFLSLEANDILFIDSTHVAKTGSDVNYIFTDILPALAPGVCIHIHDIFYPFEYPKSWILGGRSWNELYVLRAFLQYNSAFEILIMNTFLEAFHRERFAERMPLCLKNTGGSIWLRKK